MDSFTKQRTEAWTGKTYDGLACGPRFTDESRGNTGTGVHEYFSVSGTGAPSLTRRLQDTYQIGFSNRSEFGVNNGITFSSSSETFSSTGGSTDDDAYFPPTYTILVPAWTIVPTSAASTSTVTQDATVIANESASGALREILIRDDTSRGFSQSESNRSGFTMNSSGDPTSSSTESGSDSTSYPGGDTSSVNLTVHGSSHFATRTAFLYYETNTITYTGYTVEGGDPVYVNFVAVSTSSSSWTTSTNTTTGTGVPTTTNTTDSSWNTCLTSLTTNTTTTEMGTDESNEVTALEDCSSYSTEVAGTGTDTYTRVKDFTITHHSNSPLQDTVILLGGGVTPEHYNLGHGIWLFNKYTASNLTSHSTGAFTDFFESSSGATMTVSDYQKFITSSFSEGTVTLNSTTYETVETATDTASPNTTHTVTGTATNGVFTTNTSDSTFLSTEITETFSLGVIGTMLVTAEEEYVTNTDTAAPLGTSTGSTTYFTHTDFISGHETDGAWNFTQGTSIGYWSSTSRTFSTEKWASTFRSTVDKAVRVVTEDTILAASHTVVGTGTNTSRVFLGNFSTVTSRVISSMTSFTSKAYYIPEMCSIDTISHSESGEFASDHLTNGSTGITYLSEGHSLSRWTYKRAGIRVQSSRAGDNAPYDDMVRYTVPARGHIGFVGSFTQPDRAVYLTTEFGLASGGVFDTGWSMVPPPAKELFEGAGATIYPVNERNLPSLIGSGLSRSSLMAVPTAMTTRISVAATWTSTQTYLSGTSELTSTVSTTAVHTMGMADQITGEFLTEHPISMSNGDSNIGINGIFAATGGWGAGDNRMDAPATVFIRMGRVSWTERSGSQSTGGATQSTQGENLTVSYTISMTVICTSATVKPAKGAEITGSTLGTLDGVNFTTGRIFVDTAKVTYNRAGEKKIAMTASHYPAMAADA